jgi:hypothetical protein
MVTRLSGNKQATAHGQIPILQSSRFPLPVQRETLAACRGLTLNT